MASSSKVVVIILGVVGGVLLLSCGVCGGIGFFVWRGVQEQNHAAQCKNNLRYIVLGMQNHQDQRGDLPPLYIADAEGRPLHSWRVLLLPYIEDINLWRQIRLNEPWDSEYNKQFHSQMPPIYACPASPHPRESGLTSYFAMSGEGTPLEPLTLDSTDDQMIRRYRSPTSLASIIDGPSMTVMVVEATGYSVNWMQPVDIPLDDLHISQGENDKGIGSPHPGDAIYVGFGDGRIMALKRDIPLEELRKLLIRNDQAPVDEQWFAH